jgi:RNA polymerase sigma-70 factor, ECF subfamily
MWADGGPVGKKEPPRATHWVGKGLAPMTDWTDVAARHGPAVWKAAYRLVRCDADAADCFQEAFLGAVRAERSGPVRDWGALLRHLAVARGLDVLRRRRRWGGDGDCDGVPAAAAGPEKEAQGAELAGRLRAAIAHLPRRQAEVFCLRCMEELSYEDIASRLGLRVNAVGVLLNHARQRLRHLLEEPAAGRKG